MNSYETIIIFDHLLGEAVMKEESKKIQTLITNSGGVNVVETAWGRKEIPYIHNRMADGFFVCFTYQSAKGTTVAEIESLLRITENVEKFQTHKTSLPVRKFKGNPKAKTYAEGDDDFNELEADY